ncbi:hypothetical protein EC991_003745 [Linnemannia zychae]|nr:hypothetical protein EC991_003745 [Linnemannia zychae]
MAAGVALIGILTGAKSFVDSATGEGNVSQEVVASRQFIQMNFISRTIPSWITSVDFDTSIEEALTKAVNDSRTIPNPKPSVRYRPRLSKYELVCERLDFDVFTNEDNSALKVLNDGCATVTLGYLGSTTPDDSRSYIVPRSKGRAKVVLPSGGTFDEAIFDVSTTAKVRYRGQNCTSDSNSIRNDITSIGITTPPTTTLTKCIFPTGDEIHVSIARIRFFSPDSKRFHAVATSLFGNQDELISGMLDSVNNGPLTNPPKDDELMIVVEVKIVGTDITALICSRRMPPFDNPESIPYIACAYTSTSVSIVKSQSMNPDITKKLTPKGIYNVGDMQLQTSILSLYHLPLLTETVSYPIAKIVGSSSVMVNFSASLGNNFVLDWDALTLYVIFDVVEIVQGYELPDWLFITIIVVMGLCFIFWGITEGTVDSRYKDSLYFSVSKELTSGHEIIAPRLYRFDPRTLELEGRRIVSTGGLPLASNETGLYRLSTDGSEERLVRAF